MLSLLITYFLVALVTSFLCSLWEAVLLSITPAFAELKLEEGTRLGQRLQRFKVDIDRPLAAILTLNTIAHTVGAIGVGGQAILIWADANPLITGLFVPASMTIGILVLSEIIPKTLGANYWKELAPFTVRSLTVIIILLYPLVWASQGITRVLKKEKTASVFTRRDFLTLAEIGERSGVFDPKETHLLHNLLRFRSLCARDIMTPRPVVKVASEDLSAREFFELNRGTRNSRIPVYAGTDTESITGYVRRDDVLRTLVDGRDDTPVKNLRRDILSVPETCPIVKLFDNFLETRNQMVLVVDEYGGLSGIATMEDVIETLLGLEIVDELDTAEDMQGYARKIWEARARKLGLIDD